VLKKKGSIYIHGFINLFEISNIQRINFRQDINGLRAIAVLSVVFYHADFEQFKGGWLGVDIFFVISGFLISNIIISELNNETFSFKNFYIRRIKRIFPALFFLLTTTIPIAYFLLTPKAMEEFTTSMISSIFFYANYHFINLDFYIAESTKVMPLLHTWSLAIEEQYYLLFPLFSFFVFKYFKKYFALFIVVITFGSIYMNTYAVGSDKFYKLEYRIWELLLGVIVMIVSNNFHVKHLEKIGLPLMLFPIFYFGDNWINDTEPKLIALIGVSLIIFSNSKDSYLSKILQFKPLSMIGVSSYSIYLLHQPIFAFYRIFIDNYNLIKIRVFDLSLTSVNIFNYLNIEISEIFQSLNVIFLIFLIFLIGYFSYINVELKFVHKNQLLVLFIIIASFLISQEISTRTYLSSRSFDYVTNNETVLSDYDCWNRLSGLDDNFQNLNECIINNNSNQYLLIIGDSSTIALHKYILKERNLDNYNYIFVSMETDNILKNYDQKIICEDCFIEWMRENKLQITTVVLFELHRWIEENGIYVQNIRPNFRDPSRFASWIELLSKNSKSLVLVEPFPTMVSSQMNPKDLVSVLYNSLQEIYIPLSDWYNNTPNTYRVLSSIKNSHKNVYRLEINDLLCQKQLDKCLIYEKPIMYYVDKTHLTQESGGLILNKLFNLLDTIKK